MYIGKKKEDREDILKCQHQLSLGGELGDFHFVLFYIFHSEHFCSVIREKLITKINNNTIIKYAYHVPTTILSTLYLLPHLSYEEGSNPMK